MQIIGKLKEKSAYNQTAMNYVYRLISVGRKDVAFKILLKIVKKAGPEYRESIGYSILDIVKELKNGFNAIEDIENTFEVSIFYLVQGYLFVQNRVQSCFLKYFFPQDLLNKGGTIGPRSAEAILDQLQDVLTPQMSSSLEKLTAKKES